MSIVIRSLIVGARSLGVVVATGFGLAAEPPGTTSTDARGALRHLSVMDYGAAGDGQRNDTQAIQAAIDECSRLGGRLVFPAGRYLTGTFYIKKNVELHLAKDAVILGSTNIKDYATDTGGIRYDTPWMDRCLICAAGADHIAITGEGTLDGQGSQKNFPPGKLRLDRPMLLRLFNCRNVVLRDFKPEFFEFKGDLPAYGLFLRHATGIRLINVNLDFAGKEERPAIVWDDVTGLDAAGLRTRCAEGVPPMVKY